MIKKDFWLWLYKKSQKKLRDLHLRNQGCDLKCPHCQQWYSLSGIEHNHYIRSVGHICSAVCGACKRQTFWDLSGPVPLICDHDGTPLNGVKEQ